MMNGVAIRATVVVCPFAQFGSPGAQAGAELVADAVRELIADNRRETRLIRGHAYQLRLREIPLRTADDLARWHRRARRLARHVLASGDFLVWVGGNHLGVMPLYEELGRLPDSLVVQFDGHLDTYEYDDCSEELSHGNFVRFLKRPPKIINLGHRDLFLPESAVQRHFAAAYSAADLAIDPGPALTAVRSAALGANRVVIDLDCDALDPSAFAAVAEPVPFGLRPDVLLRLADAAVGRNFAGVAVSEFDGGRDVNDRCLATVLWWIEYWLLRRAEAAGGGLLRAGE